LCLELSGEGCHVLRALLYLTRLELFVIHVVCQWCVAGAAIMAAALLLTIVRAAWLMG
jgi:uncharacterized membrane protein